MKKLLITLSFATLIFGCKSQTKDEIRFSSARVVSMDYMDSVNGHRLVIPIGINNPLASPDTFPVFLLVSDTNNLNTQVVLGYRITYINWRISRDRKTFVDEGLETTFRDEQFKEFPENIIIWDARSRKKWITSNSYMMQND